MRYPFSLGALLVVLGMTMAGCGDAPTQPPSLERTPTPKSPPTPTPTLSKATPAPTRPGTQSTPTVTRTPSPVGPTPTPAKDLNGAWTGTISFGTDYVKPCPAHESIQVTLSQVGNEFTGSLQTTCEGLLELHGTFTGTSLVAVDLWKANETSIGVLKGSATPSRIYAENRDGAPWDYGDPTIGLDLSR